ncbi:MAG: hypothetical protein U9N07_06690 [Euryarchaeota archaeon]|nr:hypothetical protein [Euryarchaeota archaeon]
MIRNILAGFVYFIIILHICIPCALASSATITLDSVIDTPDRTITYDDEVYEITDIGIYRIDHDINASVSVSGIQSFQISLIDKDKKPVWDQIIYHTDGCETVIIPAGTTEIPGTYALTIWYQGQILAMKPVMISVYDLSVSSASRVESGGILHVVVDINRDGVPVTVDETVKVVLSQGSTLFEGVATLNGAGEYEADINIPAIASGSFSLYCAVTTDRMILGYPEIIGAASYGTVDVIPPEEVSPTYTPIATAEPSEVVSPTPIPVATKDSPWAVCGSFAAILMLITAYLVRRKRDEK